MNSDFIISVFEHEQRVRLGWKGDRLTRTDGGKIALSIVKGSWVRILANPKNKSTILTQDNAICNAGSSDKSADAVA